VVTQGISQQLLEWKGIEATERLATSPNAKVVVIGSPRNGLPLILEPKRVA
jgi:prohibitin 1